jgi:hypothetical protein
VTHPVALLRGPAADLDDALVDDGVALAVDPELRAAGEEHLRAVLAAAPATWNGPILGYRGLRGDAVVGGPTDYFSMLATSDALAAEWPDGGPQRTRAAALAGGRPETSGAGRASVVGVALVVVLAHGGREWLLLGRRRDDLAIAPSEVSTIDGCAEPTGEPRPLRANLLRELAEEAPAVLAAARPPTLRPLGVSLNLLRWSPTLCAEARIALDAPPEGLSLSGEEFSDALLVPATPAGLERLWTRREPLAPPAVGALALWERARAGLW